MDELISEAANELAEIVAELERGIEFFTTLIKLRRELDEHGN